MMAISGGFLRAETTEKIEATSNATVQTTGVRTGANNINFLNVEGSNNNAFASFGLVEFDFMQFGLTPETVDSVNSIQLVFTESNASFTRPGSLAFFITTDLDASLSSGSPTPFFDAGDTQYGIGAQLSDLYLLGTGSFNTSGNTGSGTQDTYTFSLSGAAQAYVREQIINGERFRIVIAPNGSPGVAATWAGYNHNTYSGPQVSFTYTSVPEASAATLMMFGGTFLAGLRRRRAGAVLE